MADSVPLQWKKKGHARVWDEVDELVYQDIVDGATRNKWETLTLPVAPNTLEVRADEAGNYLWREHDTNGTIVRGGAFPPWMVVSVSWTL